MPLNEIVNVQITRDTQTVSQAGFGTLMILDTHKRFNERIRFYSNIDDVAEDFDSSSLSFIAAQDVFSQSPRPNLLAIGRRKSNSATVEIVSSQAGETYSVVINEVVNSIVAETSAEQSTIELDDDLVAGNEIDIELNGNPLPTVNFDTDHFTTMSLIASELENQPTVLSAVISGTDNRTITIQSMPLQNAVVDSFDITGGASQATVTITNVIQPINTSIVAELLKDEINANVNEVTATTPSTPDGTLTIESTNPTDFDFTLNFNQSFTLTNTALVTVTQIIPSREYTIRIAGIPFRFIAPQNVQTNEEIAQGLVQVINQAGEAFGAVDNEDGTFTVDSLDPFSIVGSNLLSVDIAFNVKPIVASSPISEDLDAINEENSDWYAIVYTSREQSDVIEIAEWVEPRIKIFGTASSDTDILTIPAGTDNSTVAGILSQGGFARTFVMYHQDAENDFPEAAWFGRTLPTNPGSITWKFKTLNSISFSELTTSQSLTVRNKNANTYEFIGGVSITREGTMAVGEFIDIIRGIDWLQARIQENVYSLLVNSPKVPYTNAGITAIEAEIRRSLTEGVTNDFIATEPAFTVTTPNVSDVSQADKANRVLRNVTFQATLAGAIHVVEINGVVSI